MQITVITLFPEMLAAITDYGITGRAVQQGLIAVDTVNPRDFTDDRHQTVDDRPYGGGPGMVMKVEPLQKAIGYAKQESGAKQASGARQNPEVGRKSGKLTKVIYLSPQGRKLDQAGVEALAKNDRLILIAGRYEGIDERLIESEVDEEWSIGDYVLSGGELAAMVLIDATVRQLPGALGHEDSAREDSFADGLLDCPHYTRPEVLAGRAVPQVLLSGDHEKIRHWRLKQALGRTWLRRRELLENRALDAEEQALLAEFVADWTSGQS